MTAGSHAGSHADIYNTDESEHNFNKQTAKSVKRNKTFWALTTYFEIFINTGNVHTDPLFKKHIVSKNVVN